MASSTCCGKNAGGECVCAKQATCSCGKQSALACTCQKAPTENDTSGDRCPCGKRAAGHCTCDNPTAAKESAPNPNETDFTTQK